MSRRSRITAVAAIATSALCLLAAVAGPQAASALSDIAGAPQGSMELRVLVLDDGTPMIRAVIDRLTAEGVPHRVVDLRGPKRPTITREFLAQKVSGGVVGRYSAVALPTAAPAQLSGAELATLADYEARFGVREFSAYSWANAELGLQPVDADRGMSGPVDGRTGEVTPAAQRDGFGYLRGTFTYDDYNPDVIESWAYAAMPDHSGSFTPFVEISLGGGQRGAVLGVHHSNGRERLVSTAAMNAAQSHWKTLSHGIVQWMTKGVTVGYSRNYFSVHVDDVVMDNRRWSIDHKCTYEAGCPADTPMPAAGPATRMGAADLAYAKAWQDRFNFKLDMAYNGFGSTTHVETHPGPDALVAEMVKYKNDFRWISHTYQHTYLGCLQPEQRFNGQWDCIKDAKGNIQYRSEKYILDQLAKNQSWADSIGLPTDKSELITGEHSGLKSLPQMPIDNPNLAPAINTHGVGWVASDASRERLPRRAGNAWTLPRYPMAVFYNAARFEENTSEYNWIYTRRADGGSGMCEDNPQTSTCITPLDLKSGFDTYIRPLEARTAYNHVLGNDIKPHYVHQANIAEDRILYPIVEDVLNRYRSVFADNTPVLNPTMAQAGRDMLRQSQWAASVDMVSARVTGSKLTVSHHETGTIQVPLTAPAGTKAPLEAYWGSLSGWLSIPARTSRTFTLSASPYRSDAKWFDRTEPELGEPNVAPLASEAEVQASNVPAGRLPDGAYGPPIPGVDR